jgi:hypothetical protein
MMAQDQITAHLASFDVGGKVRPLNRSGNHPALSRKLV